MSIQTIFIVDDHQVYRDGLKSAIKNNPQYRLIGEASDGSAALEQIVELKPDIVFMDIIMPVLDGIDLLKALKNKELQTKFIVLSQFAENLQIHEFMDLGISGYVLKSESTEEIIRALHSVSCGQQYFSPYISQKLFSILKKTHEELKMERSFKHSSDITPKDLEIAKLVSQGKTNKEIGALLGLSEHTIKNHKSNLMRKIGAHNSAEISAWVVKASL